MKIPEPLISSGYGSKLQPEFEKLIKKVRAEVKRRKDAGYTVDPAGKDFLEWQLGK